MKFTKKIPFVALGEDYSIEYVFDDSLRDEIIEFLAMFGIDVSTIPEEELEMYLEAFGYTGPEVYLEILTDEEIEFYNKYVTAFLNFLIITSGSSSNNITSFGLVALLLILLFGS